MTLSPSASSFTANPGLRQFAKFCIVGFSSFAIDAGLFNLLYLGFHWPMLLAKAVSFLLAVGNGFYWNRRWTFRQAQGGDVKRQYPIFVLTNTVGLLLNLSIMTGSLILAERLGLVHTQRSAGEILGLIITGQGRHAFQPLVVNSALVVATVIVTAWNFTASRVWTFRQS